MAATATTTTAT